ncbi:MAG TPA: hypothetical protein VHR45_02010 [Thermoanaerobaculia bacterium]|nr:hypothetical protein [Thermoanaerobaculia bacterium]
MDYGSISRIAARRGGPFPLVFAVLPWVCFRTASCGEGRQTTQVNIQQSGEQISFLLGVDTGSVSGTIMGRTVALSWEEGVDAGIICHGTLSGTGSVDGRVISGTVFGPTTCCGPSATISFTLTPR